MNTINFAANQNTQTKNKNSNTCDTKSYFKLKFIEAS